jgi:hypothetical protein
MKVTANQQVVTRPELVEANKPGFHNFGKDAKVNTIGQLASQSEGSKEIKRTLAFENKLGDTGLQNVGQKEEKKSQFLFEGVGQKEEKEPKLPLEDVGQKGRAIDAFV